MSHDTSRDEQFESLQRALAGTWSLERELGRGGMGTVYLARDVALERPVAIKVLDPELAKDPEQHDRFLREARTGAKLSHPHIVPIYAVEEAAGHVYIVMGLVDGESVREWIHRDGPLKPQEALRVLREIGWALGYAHAMGTLHRDVTLDNILIDRRTHRAMLADFGIAAEIDREDAGPLLGTPAYLAPELVQGEPASPRSDLYALGITAWAMLSGRLPFQTEEQGAVLLQQITEPVPSLAAAAPGTPSRLVRAIEACMSKSPSDRPASVESWVNSLGDESRQVALAGPLEKWADQWRQVRAFYALALSVAAMIGGMMIDFDVFYSRLLPWFLPVFLIPLVVYAVPMLGVAWAIHRMIEVRMLRAAARAGYRIDDLRLALRRQITMDQHERATQTLPLPARVIRVVNRISLSVYVLTGILVMLSWFAMLNWGQAHPFPRGGGGVNVPLPWYDISDATAEIIAQIMRWSYVTLWTGLGLKLLLPSRATWFTRWRESRRLKYWNGKRGERELRQVTYGIRAIDAPEHTLHRPTELMLDLEIEDIWRALPATYRGANPQIPKLARSLRMRVAELKELSQKLEAPSIASTTEIRALRQRLAARQEAGVTGLERLRMMLCQLGDASAQPSEFTEQLQDLRSVEASLLEELGAHSDLLKLIAKPGRRGGLTPSPTPA